MRRLTDKEKVAYATKQIETNGELCDDHVFQLSKLGALENIEEEIGIDLITLFKALKDGIYIRKGHNFYNSYPNEKWAIIRMENNVAYFNGRVDIALFERYKGEGNMYESKNIEYCPFDELKNNTIVGIYKGTFIELKDYGKTWALTKEELL